VAVAFVSADGSPSFDPLFLGSRVEVVVPWEGCVTLLDPLFLGSRMEDVVPWEGCAIS